MIFIINCASRGSFYLKGGETIAVDGSSPVNSTWNTVGSLYELDDVEWASESVEMGLSALDFW